MDMRQIPPQDMLRQLLDYDPETGTLTWLHRPDAQPRWNTKNVGRRAFNTPHNQGYRYGSLFGNNFLTHRVIWKWWHGADPEWIDHIDGDKTNNRIANLRSVRRELNARNMPLPKTNTSGEIGVHFCKLTNRWRAVLSMDGNIQHLGRFDTIEEAAAARDAAMPKFGFHANHGRKG